MDPEQQFRALYDANFADLLGYALRRVAEPADAADVVSETFLVAWRRLADAPPGDARPWLFGIARRVLANQHRTSRRRDRLGARLRTVLDTTFAAPAAPDPAAGVAERDAIRRALAALGPEDREILTLVAWERLSPAEAAEVLGLAPGTARMRLRRARQRFRDRLGDAGPVTGHVPGAGTDSTEPPWPTQEGP